MPQNQTQLRRTPQFPRKTNPISIWPAATNNYFKQAKKFYYCGTKHQTYPSSSFNANQQQIHELEQQPDDSSFTPNHHQPFVSSTNQIDINELFIDHVSNSNTTTAQNEY